MATSLLVFYLCIERTHSSNYASIGHVTVTPFVLALKLVANAFDLPAPACCLFLLPPSSTTIHQNPKLTSFSIPYILSERLHQHRHICALHTIVRLLANLSVAFRNSALPQGKNTVHRITFRVSQPSYPSHRDRLSICYRSTHSLVPLILTARSPSSFLPLPKQISIYSQDVWKTR